MVDDTDVNIMRQIMKEMDNTLDTLPVENMTIKNIFQQIINEADSNRERN
jgi:hypothetical protein